MTTKEFLSILKDKPNLSINFEYKKGLFARADYHLTEIKNVTFDTVDCGGIRNQWQEVHVQIWENTIPEPAHRVDTTKAVTIFEMVDSIRKNYGDVELKFEYGNKDFHTAILPIREVLLLDNQVIVQLGNEHTTCKAKDRAVTEEEKAMACCGEKKHLIEEPKGIDFTLTTIEAGDCCTPGGKCC